MARTVSNNHFSVDQQIADAVDALTTKEREEFDKEFPEWRDLKWAGSWVDTEAMGVDSEWSSWVADWIEENTGIYWEDGEPWLREDSDDEDENEDEDNG